MLEGIALAIEGLCVSTNPFCNVPKVFDRLRGIKACIFRIEVGLAFV